MTPDQSSSARRATAGGTHVKPALRTRLARRVLLPILLVAFLLAILAGSLSYWQSQEMMRGKSESMATHLLRAAGIALANSSSSHQLQRVVEALGANPEVLEVLIGRPGEGRLLAAHDPGLLGQDWSDVIETRFSAEEYQRLRREGGPMLLQGDGPLLALREIPAGVIRLVDRPSGEAWVLLSMRRDWEPGLFSTDTLYPVWWAVVVVLLYGLVSTWVVKRYVLQPVWSLERTLKAREGGDRSARTALQGWDELARLGRTLDHLLDVEDERLGLYQQIFERHDAIQWLVDPREGVLVDVNEAAARFYGFHRTEMRGMPVSKINQLSPEAVREAMARVQRGEQKVLYFPHRLASGEIREVEVHSGAVDVGGREYLHSIIHDITERRELARNRRQLVEILEASPQFIAMAEAEGRLVYLNRAGRALFREWLPGVSPESKDLTVNFAEVLRLAHPPWAVRRILEEGLPTAAREGHWMGETAFRRADGGETPLQQLIVAHRDETGRVERYSTVAEDITERKRREQALRYRASHDGLTGLYNRRHTQRALERELRLAARTGHPVSVVLFDLDHFKRVNDTHGHNAGDQVLRQLAGLVTERVRDTDIVGRWGGEEFLLVLPGTDETGAGQLAEVLRAYVAEARFPIPDPVTISLGYAQAGADEGADALFKRVDQALYAAKANGRNRAQAAKAL
ncbi:diguanylate cyclase with PAS/PAC sensor [Alkalilimnicola ehrlichii MLHE-1]|uniref:diguanylate cyclase n=1 Tax=Alkalilimnicola ehrlichii (strain ATCC BAA-1101 / DSM 17681 / MLHE-1) TaxID=187272 RepID=Q0AAU2_ALKEH|nr:diguanylate cyclase with PAS/PAC sensor [Alkalilimnicola ehrlichii MLHE-1]